MSGVLWNNPGVLNNIKSPILAIFLSKLLQSSFLHIGKISIFAIGEVLPFQKSPSITFLS
jgi:hypothetical protein